MRRRELLAANAVQPMPAGVIYEEGRTMPGHRFELMPEWSTSEKFSLAEGVFLDNMGITHTALLTTLINPAAGAIVDRIGFLGAQLMHYSTLNITVSGSGSYIASGRLVSIYSSLAGTYIQNRVAYYTITNNNTFYHATKSVTIPRNLSADSRYYISIHNQSGSGSSGQSTLNVTKIWLE